MRIAILAAVVCLVAIGLAPAVSADTSGPWTSNVIGYQATDWSNWALVLPKFNSSLGTLTEIDLFISTTMKSTLHVENRGGSDLTCDAYTSMGVTVKDPLDMHTLESDINSGIFHFVGIAPGTTANSTELTKSGTSFDTYNDQATLDEFTGSGNISLLSSTETESWIGTTNGNGRATQTSQATNFARVTYHYIPNVPEPSSLLALFTGACGFLGLARRRK